MANVRKRKSYSIGEKLIIIERVKGGVSKAQISRELGIPEGTIRGWIADEGKLLSFLDKLDNTFGLEKKKSRLYTYKTLDHCLYTWFIQNRSLNVPLSGPILKVEAEKIFKDLKLDGEFSASDAWLWRWQKRHGIDEIKVNGGAQSSEEDIAKLFLNELKFICEEYCEEQLYNCDESVLLFGMLPTKNLNSFPNEAGLKLNKDRVTILFCVNKAGSHKLPPLVIGKSKYPQCFKPDQKLPKESNNLPIEYVSNCDSCITANIFMTWFHNSFVPTVQSHMRKKNLEQKAILFLENSAAHPSATSLISKDGMIRTICLPNNMTFYQPLHQGIIFNFKTNYRLELLSSLLNSSGGVRDFLNLLTLKDFAYKISLAWDSISMDYIQGCWNKSGFLMFTNEEKVVVKTEEEDIRQIASYCDLQAVRDILQDQDITQDILNQWVDIEREALFSLVSTDEDIFESLINAKKLERSYLEIQIKEEPVDVPSDQDALQALDTVIRWLGAQDGGNQDQILQLVSMKDMILNRHSTYTE